MIKLCVNGQLQSQIEATDRGFQYGDGVFETIAFKNGHLELWQAHMERLAESATRLSLAVPDADDWMADIKALGLFEQSEDKGVIKLMLSRGVSGRGYAYTIGDAITRVTAIYPWTIEESKSTQGIKVMFCETPVSINTALAGIKHLNRLENVLARNEWQDPDISEGLMLDHHQHVVEGTMSNVFCVLDDELYTPSLVRSGVAGVMRQQIMALAHDLDIPLNEIEISKQHLINMDAVFICNSVIGIWPVKQIVDDAAEISFNESPIVLKLQQALQNILIQN